MNRVIGWIACALLSVTLGCGGSSPAPGGTGGGGTSDDAGELPHGGDLAMTVDAGGGGDCPSTASVCGHIAYGATKQGTLGVAAYPTMTPGLPDKFLTVDKPSFPQAYALSGLSDGDHYVQAILFVGHAAGMPQPGDPQSMVTKVTVHGGVPAQLDITLQ
ncbi:MAG: hypothetical protein ACXVDD_15920 [Polyangia bacterium]